MKASPLGGTFQVRSDSGLMYKVQCILGIRTYFPSLRGKKTKSNGLQCLGVSWISLTNNLKGNSNAWCWEFLWDPLWFLRGVFVSPNGKIHLNNICICTQRFMCIISTLSRQSVVWFLSHFETSLLLFYRLSLFLMYLFPSHKIWLKPPISSLHSPDDLCTPFSSLSWCSPP